MNAILKTAATLSTMLIFSSHAEDGPTVLAESAADTTPGVAVKVEKAVEWGAKAAVSGVERGVKAAAGGVERGAPAAAGGIERGAKAAAGGVEHGSKATENAAGRVAKKIGVSPESSPAAGK